MKLIRYGSRLRVRVQQHLENSKRVHHCKECGKFRVRQVSIGIWVCRACEYTVIGTAVGL